MYQKKIVKKTLGIALCACLLAGEMFPAAAAEKKNVEVEQSSAQEQTVKTVTGETPEETFADAEKTQGNRTRPVGGVGKIKAYELEQEASGVETFETELSEENIALCMETKESLGAGLSSDYGYSQLSTKEKEVYNLIKTKAFLFHVSTKNATTITLSNGGECYAAASIDVSQYGFSRQQMEKIYFAIEADYPELFWLSDTLLYSGQFVIKSWYIVVEPEYIKYSERKSANDSIKKGIVPYLEAIDNAKAAGASEMELELLIHDMIINEVDYAYDMFNNPETAAFAHSVVGVFDGNKATDVVCEGYAKSFHLLSNYAGLESIYGVGWSGSDSNGGGHAWNLIKINGSWYNIDLTWNDTNCVGYEGYSYDFFNLTTKEFNEDNAHNYRPDIFGGMYDVPEAVDTKANYYNYFGLNVTKADVATDEAFKSLIKKAVSGNEERRDNLLRFNCDSEDTLEELFLKISSKSTKTAALAPLQENGVEYSITNIHEYVDYNQMLVSVSKIYMENICQGYIFGNAKAAVYQWENREKKDVTEQYQLEYSKGAGTSEILTVTNKTSGSILGTFGYNIVTPVIGDISAVEYTGNGICPVVSLSVNGTKLQNQKDYIVEYSNNRDIGTGKILIKGIGNYAGSIEKTFVINPKNLSKLTITLSDTKYEYDGKVKKPQVVIKDGNQTLVSGTDYVVSYKNNVAIGTANVVVTGKGNYQNSKTLSFTIVPTQISGAKASDGVKLSSGTGKTLKFSWGKQTGVSGYEVSLYKGSAKVKVATTGKNSYKFSKLKENTQYTFRVRAYKKSNGTKYYGSWSPKLTVKTAAKAPTGLTVTSGNKRAVLKWKKTSGVSGYEIYMSTKQKSGYKKVATIQKASTVKYTKKKLSKNKTYYFKVRSYTKKNNFKTYSGYTAVKKVKIK